MASDAEPGKLLLPFLQRADELQKHEPLVAYYCRLYAMERGLKIPQKDRTKTTSALLVSLMNQLEKDKRSLKLGNEDQLYLEGFASSVFAKADKQDRSGRADLSTAKTFYAASIFFEILNQFGELLPDMEQKLKYAVWKAADIRKALKEGRKPEPGPPGGDKDFLVPSVSHSNANVLDSNESIQTNFPRETSSDQTVSDLGRSESLPSQPAHTELGRSESINYPGVSLSSQSAHEDLGESESFRYSGTNVSSQPAHDVNSHGASNEGISATSYPSEGYSSSDYQQFHPSYSNNYQPSYSYEQQPSAQNYPPENFPPTYSLPNFQSYPSFHESSFPAAPTDQPSYYHVANIPYSQESSVTPSLSNYQTTSQYSSLKSNGDRAGPLASPTASYKCDSNYQPSVEKIAEAHKAARFAVGALAFDDVPVAVDHLQRSLELLTNPSAQTH